MYRDKAGKRARTHTHTEKMDLSKFWSATFPPLNRVAINEVRVAESLVFVHIRENVAGSARGR